MLAVEAEERNCADEAERAMKAADLDYRSPARVVMVHLLVEAKTVEKEV